MWANIVQHLHPGTVVRNWGAARGYTGGSFEIRDVEQTSITVFGGKMQMERRISKGEFTKLYAVWASYLAGDYPRSRMLSLSQNTTYILSVMRKATEV